VIAGRHRPFSIWAPPQPYAEIVHADRPFPLSNCVLFTTTPPSRGHQRLETWTEGSYDREGNAHLLSVRAQELARMGDSENRSRDTNEERRMNPHKIKLASIFILKPCEPESGFLITRMLRANLCPITHSIVDALWRRKSH
jgi:hypothetical protein